MPITVLAVSSAMCRHSATRSGADALIDALRACGVEVVFGLPGAHNLAAWAAVSASGLRLVVVRHEQAAAYAADGYARATGRASVALVTTGPGAANTLAAVGEAHASGTPIVVIATDVPAGLKRPGIVRGLLHESADQAAMFAPVTKASYLVDSAEKIDSTVAAAALVASTPPRGPVYVQVPADLFAAQTHGEPVVSASCPPIDDAPVPDGVAAAVELIEACDRPLIWAGGGALDAAVEVAGLAEALGAPVLTTNAASGLLGSDPSAVGMPPHLPEVGQLWDRADLVIAIGTDFDGPMTQDWAQPAPHRLLTVNVDPVDAAKNYEPDVSVAARADIGVAGIRAALPAGTRRGSWADLTGLRESTYRRLGREHPAEMTFLRSCAGALPAEAIVVCDMCIPGYWLTALHQPPAPRRLHQAWGWGTLGYAFPAAIGAAVAGYGPVVSISGDGGFLFGCAELATLCQEQLPLTAVVVDDGGYGMLRGKHNQSTGSRYGVDLRTPDFAQLALSFGVHSEVVDGVGDEFAHALARHVTSDQPSLLWVRARLDPPPTTRPRWYRNDSPVERKPAL
jgi:thiamine pyrophosphate-dependent acetolactate synthase large subunit-like protein